MGQIQDRVIGRIPLYFGEYDPGKTYYYMNRVTQYGSEFQLRDESSTGISNVPPIVLTADNHIDFERSNFAVNNSDPSKKWYIISNATSSFDSSANIDNINKRIDDLVEQYLKEEENQEFVEVHLDSSSRVLYGVQRDGNFYFGGGVPRQILEVIPGVDPDIQGSVYYGPNPDPNGEGNSSRSVNNSISGVYQVNISAGSHIYFFIPSSVNQFYATINGMEIPFSESLITIDGQQYKKYESVNTYEESTFNIVLA